ncbi:MAG: tRNA (adenosine(37)-N6)-threonylcarbamoyltransferase complex dimerization subunit type 1 TsaB [Armatimonadota bacterium]|jgi:tRNA threonylcarbamoyladenosine biosynthesis protein TsaB
MILGIETSGEMTSLALVDGEHLVREDAFPSQMALCQRLVPRIESLLHPERESDPGAPPGLSAIAVSLGPGSFTSLRIAVATVKALAHAWSVDVVGVPTAHAIADGFTDVPEGAAVCAVTVARKDHVYLAIAERAPQKRWRDAEPCKVYTIDDLTEYLATRDDVILLCGEAAPEHAASLQERLGSRLRVAPSDQLRPTARNVALVGAAELTHRGPDDLFSLTPIYAQPSQAEAARGIDLGL